MYTPLARLYIHPLRINFVFTLPLPKTPLPYNHLAFSDNFSNQTELADKHIKQVVFQKERLNLSLLNTFDRNHASERSTPTPTLPPFTPSYKWKGKKKKNGTLFGKHWSLFFSCDKLIEIHNFLFTSICITPQCRVEEKKFHGKLLNSVDQSSSVNYSLQGKVTFVTQFSYRKSKLKFLPLRTPPFPLRVTKIFAFELSQYKNIIIILVRRLSSILPKMKTGVIRSPGNF